MKQILFYTSSLEKGGAQRVIVNLAHYLTEKGYEVGIVTTNKGKEEYSISAKVKRIYSDITEEEVTSSRICNFIKSTHSCYLY